MGVGKSMNAQLVKAMKGLLELKVSKLCLDISNRWIESCVWPPLQHGKHQAALACPCRAQSL